jgi:hypothetical protein
MCHKDNVGKYFSRKNLWLIAIIYECRINIG